MQKLDGTGATVMNVVYDPFGNMISGILVGEYGFSTKPLIDSLDWYYYGFRYYDPETGRWPNRDPISHIYKKFFYRLDSYLFLKNRPTSRIDLLGLIDLEESDDLYGDDPDEPYRSADKPPPGYVNYGSCSYRCQLQDNTDPDALTCNYVNCVLVINSSQDPYDCPSSPADLPASDVIAACETCPSSTLLIDSIWAPPQEN
jgi:RHS repeat-associated protein